MHHLSLNVRKILDEAAVPPEQRNAYISFVIAQSLAYQFDIPSSPVDSSAMFFAERYRTQAEKLLSNFNEHFIIDIPQCLKLTEQVYSLRYDFVHRPNATESRTLLRFLISYPNDSISSALRDIQLVNLDKEFFDTFADLMSSFTAEWKSGMNPV